MNDKITCIIPAFNEGDNLSKIVSEVSKLKKINEIIIIDDNSTDESIKKIKKDKKIKILINKTNKGKSFSVMIGLKKSKNQLILLLDADLKNLNKSDISNLINPLLRNEADISLSFRKSSVGFYDTIFCNFFKIDILTGERVFNKKIINNINELNTIPPFGLEIYLNNLIIKNNLKIKVVPWPKVYSPLKSKKYGYFIAFKEYIKAIFDVLVSAKIYLFLYQFIKMRNLRV